MANIPNWIPGTGSYVIEELTAQDSVLKHLDIGTKYMRCTSAGTIAIQSKAAYGTWEWDMMKNLAGGVAITFFISNKNQLSGNTGYVINFNSNEAIYFQEYGATNHFITATSYIVNNVWYRVKVTRTKDGEFYAYIKGGSFGNTYVLVDVTGGSGTNPVTDTTHTTSEYLVLDFDAGDRLANLIITEGVQQ
ncbi:MAG: hypothetical protein ACW98X_27505 [Promethearchaeota archaeon]|jgi:hypothetical protein